ncbi:hypothetical protein LINPERPRIM_LOCUS839 [Linum perenne]
MRDYFSPNLTYNDRIFRRRFQMRIGLFNRVLGDIVRYDSSFSQRQDALGRLSLSPEQKITSVLRMLAYDSSANSVDEYCRIGASTTLACFKQFYNVVVNIYSSTYLRDPNSDDMRKLLQKTSRRGFPGMIDLLTACIGNGGIARLLGKERTRVTCIDLLSFSMRSLHTTHGYGMLSLKFLDQTIILLMFLGCRPSSIALSMVQPQELSSP